MNENEKAVEKLKMIRKQYNRYEITHSIDLAIKALEQRPQGKWIVDYQENEDALFRRGWKCPVCGTRNTYGMPPYCMYCGARLEKADGQK